MVLDDAVFAEGLAPEVVQSAEDAAENAACNAC